MPLGQRAGDASESRYCGADVAYSEDIHHTLAANLAGGFDFIVAPLTDPSYRPSEAKPAAAGGAVVPPFAGSDLVLSPSQWSSHVVGKLSTWADVDSPDALMRSDSETVIKQEISWASHLSLQACLLPTPRALDCGNYARCGSHSYTTAVAATAIQQLWQPQLYNSCGSHSYTTAVAATAIQQLWQPQLYNSCAVAASYPIPPGGARAVDAHPHSGTGAAGSRGQSNAVPAALLAPCLFCVPSLAWSPLPPHPPYPHKLWMRIPIVAPELQAAEGSAEEDAVMLAAEGSPEEDDGAWGGGDGAWGGGDGAWGGGDGAWGGGDGAWGGGDGEWGGGDGAWGGGDGEWGGGDGEWGGGDGAWGGGDGEWGGGDGEWGGGDGAWGGGDGEWGGGDGAWGGGDGAWGGGDGEWGGGDGAWGGGDGEWGGGDGEWGGGDGAWGGGDGEWGGGDGAWGGGDGAWGGGDGEWGGGDGAWGGGDGAWGGGDGEWGGGDGAWGGGDGEWGGGDGEWGGGDGEWGGGDAARPQHQPNGERQQRDPNTNRMVNDSWEWWNAFRCLCEHHGHLSVALDITGSLPSPSALHRWLGEPVRAAILHTSIVICGQPLHGPSDAAAMEASAGSSGDSGNEGSDGGEWWWNAVHMAAQSSPPQESLVPVPGVHTATVPHTHPPTLSGPSFPPCFLSHRRHSDTVIPKHPLRLYLEYIAHLYRKLDPLTEQERFEYIAQFNRKLDPLTEQERFELASGVVITPMPSEPSHFPPTPVLCLCLCSLFSPPPLLPCFSSVPFLHLGPLSVPFTSSSPCFLSLFPLPPSSPSFLSLFPLSPSSPFSSPSFFSLFPLPLSYPSIHSHYSLPLSSPGPMADRLSGLPTSPTPALILAAAQLVLICPSVNPLSAAHLLLSLLSHSLPNAVVPPSLPSSPSQPLMDNLEAQTYETFEKDATKYSQYQKAVYAALMDRMPESKAESSTVVSADSLHHSPAPVSCNSPFVARCFYYPSSRSMCLIWSLRPYSHHLSQVLMVVGAGRGPLVRASLQAAAEAGRKLKVYAVEKNPNAVVTLHSLVALEGWQDMVTIVSSDMRSWKAPELADILVSELLGSFGDNELSPECLDGAQRFLKPDGISIPASYTSYIGPITSSKLHNDVKGYNDLAHFETAYVVKLHSAARLTEPKEVFTFTHPNRQEPIDNTRYKRLLFDLPPDTGSALVHGFGGYFDAVLYGDVHLGIEPATATPSMFSWFPIFFPLRFPVYVPVGEKLEVHFWRCVGPTKVWYEWAVTAPSMSPVHNPNGRSYWVGL
ncbi:unnamed protein product [Closterium sp. NIES-65]|nr:unnamed protein product [Closterium sp. NIES-65]